MSSIIREVIRDCTIPGGMRSPVIEAHIININAWYTSVPKHLHIEDDSRQSVTNLIQHRSDRDCTAMASRLYGRFWLRKLIHCQLHLRCLNLGTIGTLLSQRLITATRLRTADINTRDYANLWFVRSNLEII
jgi:hypothetical protein